MKYASKSALISEVKRRLRELEKDIIADIEAIYDIESEE